MNWIKNFLYDKNDIFVALVLVAIAALLIFWRVEVILDYPQKMVEANAGANAAYEPITTPIDMAGTTADGDGDNAGEVPGSEDPNSGIVDANGNGEPEIFAVYINPGDSVDAIGAIMVQLGLFESIDQFKTYVTSMGADTKIQVGNHFIPENATREEVISYICNPGL